MTHATHHRLARRTAMTLTLFASTAATAQDRFPVATGQSDRSAFRLQGLPAGGFRLYPALRATIGYDDNVRLDGGRRGGDGVVTLAPTLAARSQWSRHALEASAFLRDNRYLARGALDNDEYGVAADGRLDVLRTLTVTAAAGYSRLIEDRGTPGDLGLVDRFVRYDVATASASVTQRFNRIAATVGANGSNFRYADANGGAGGGAAARPDQRFRDRDVRGLTGRAEYQYSAATSLFVSGGVNRIRYRAVPAGGVDRASSGWSVLGGARFELGRLLGGEAGVGYIAQSFRDPRFGSFSGINYTVSLRYAPTALTSVRLAASRRLTDSAQRAAGGVLVSTATLSAEHELLRNLILAADASHSRYDFRGIAGDYSRYDVGVGARYRVSNALSAALSVSRVGQGAGGGFGRRFDSNRVSLSLLVAR